MEDLAWLSQRVGQQLLDKQIILSTAESCTGGLVASTVIDMAGSSQWFERGYVTYSNQAKIDELGVQQDTLAQYGAVSEQTAAEMAEGVLNQLKRVPNYIQDKVHCAVSTTGVAGPTGGSDAKPVGMVCFGLAYLRAGEIFYRQTETVHFKGDRTAIRQQAVAHVLKMVLNTLVDDLSVIRCKQ